MSKSMTITGNVTSTATRALGPLAGDKMVRLRSTTNPLAEVVFEAPNSLDVQPGDTVSIVIMRVNARVVQPPNPFKVGDRVRVVKDANMPFGKGDETTVKELIAPDPGPEHGQCIRVGNSSQRWSVSRFEKVANVANVAQPKVYLRDVRDLQSIVGCEVVTSVGLRARVLFVASADRSIRVRFSDDGSIGTFRCDDWTLASVRLEPLTATTLVNAGDLLLCTFADQGESITLPGGYYKGRLTLGKVYTAAADGCGPSVRFTNDRGEVESAHKVRFSKVVPL